MSEFERIFAIGQEKQSLWKERAVLSIVVLAGFFVSTAFEFNGMKGAIAVGLISIIYFEIKRYSKIILVIDKGETRIYR